jgi:hypothetical protein
MHSIEYKYAPLSFANTWTKHNTQDLDYNLRNSHLYIIPNVRIEMFRKIPLISLPMSWNEISDELRFQQNRKTFKIALFDQLMEQ